MTYTGIGINDSATIVMETAASMTAPRCKAVKFDTNGKAALCGAGEAGVGLLLAETDDTVAAGASVDVQIKDIGRWVAGAAIKAGAEVASDANGAAVTATSGNFILGIALEAADAAGDIIQVQIAKAGYKA